MVELDRHGVDSESCGRKSGKRFVSQRIAGAKLLPVAGSVCPHEGPSELVERHNERLDLPPEVWSKEIIAEAVHRSGTAV